MLFWAEKGTKLKLKAHFTCVYFRGKEHLDLTLVEGKPALLAGAGSQHPISKDDQQPASSWCSLGMHLLSRQVLETPWAGVHIRAKVLKSSGCCTFLPWIRLIPNVLRVSGLAPCPAAKRPSLDCFKHRAQWWLLWTPLSCPARTGEVTFLVSQGHLHLHGHLLHICLSPVPLLLQPILPPLPMLVYFPDLVYIFGVWANGMWLCREFSCSDLFPS